MAETLFSSGAPTAEGTSVIRVPQVEAPTYASLALRAALLRDRAEVTQSEVADLHRETQLGRLDERTSIVSVQEPGEVLDELATQYGLSWATIARLVGVSDTAVRKWRRGEHIAPENRRRLAQAGAFLQTVGEYPIPDPGAWLEMPISNDATVKAIDVYVRGKVDLLLELAGHRMTAHQVLDAFDLEWRREFGVDDRFTVVEGNDGEMAVVERRSGE